MTFFCIIVVEINELNELLNKIINNINPKPKHNIFIPK